MVLLILLVPSVVFLHHWATLGDEGITEFMTSGSLAKRKLFSPGARSATEAMLNALLFVLLVTVWFQLGSQHAGNPGNDMVYQKHVRAFASLILLL